MSFDSHRGALSRGASERPHEALSPSNTDDAVPGSARTPEELALQVWFLVIFLFLCLELPPPHFRVHAHITLQKISTDDHWLPSYHDASHSLCFRSEISTVPQAARDAVLAAETSLAAVNARHAAASARSVEVRVDSNHISLEHLVSPVHNRIALF